MATRTILVTGGSNGIGLETCSVLAHQPNTHVLLGSRSLEKGNKALADIQAKSPQGSISVVQLDVDSDASIAQAVKQVEDAHGKLDTLINNAGICPVEVSRDLFRATFDTNCTSPALVTEAFAPLLRKSKTTPRVIYVTSVLGSVSARADPNDPVRSQPYKIYRMSKAATNMLALSDACEYEKDGFRVFAYCPGLVATDLAGLREAKLKWGAPGPEKSAQGLLAICNGEQDQNAARFLHTDSVVDGSSFHQW